MHAAILCPGPSLSRLTDRPAGCELVVGVNRAATIIPCDVWAGCDLPMILKYGDEVLGKPTLLLDESTDEELRRRSSEWRGPRLHRNKLEDFCPASLEWGLFSATSALIFAAYVGADKISVFGVDWTGTADFDGQQAGMNRSPARWELERAIWEKRLVPWLNQRGVKVERVVSA